MIIFNKDETEFEGEAFINVDFAANAPAGAEFSGCSFKDSNLQSADLRSCRFLGCVFERCNLSLADVSGAALRGVRFSECKGVGINWSDVRVMHSVDFSECLLNSSVFTTLDLRRVTFTSCSLVDAVFADVNLRKCLVHNCDLTRTSFRGCDLRQADFRKSTGYLIDPINNRVIGAKFSLPDAISFLQGIGIEVE